MNNDKEWWEDHDNLAILAKAMADEGDTTGDIVYMLEKPWKYAEEWRAAEKNATA